MVRRFPIESCLGKREKLARFAWRSGFTHILERLPKRACLIVLAYHRVGDPEQCLYASGVIEATPEQFDRQMIWLWPRKDRQSPGCPLNISWQKFVEICQKEGKKYLLSLSFRLLPPHFKRLRDSASQNGTAKARKCSTSSCNLLIPLSCDRLNKYEKISLFSPTRVEISMQLTAFSIN